jgi:hypothetical protein
MRANGYEQLFQPRMDTNKDDKNHEWTRIRSFSFVRVNNLSTRELPLFVSIRGFYLFLLSIRGFDLFFVSIPSLSAIALR